VIRSWLSYLPRKKVTGNIDKLDKEFASLKRKSKNRVKYDELKSSHSEKRTKLKGSMKAL